MKKVGMIMALIAVIGAVIWWSIGPDWRRLLSNPPSGNDVLFWEHDQRDAGFRMLDRVPFIVQARDIDVGLNVRELEKGPPIELEFDIDAYFADQNHAALIILHDGKIRHEQYGLDFDETGRWTSFSVAKSITSSLVGAAILDGHIQSLEDQVSDYIPGLKGSAYEQVSIHQLLTMTSGVRWIEDYGDPNSDVAVFTQHVAENGGSNLVSYMGSLPRAHEPGSVWNYSTGETNLIGILVSDATGKPLADYLAEKIWTPFGMEQNATWLLNEDGSEISGCCIQAAPRDFARYGQFILEGGRAGGTQVLPEGWIETATTSHVGETYKDLEGYGYQWWTNSDGSFEASGIFGQGIYIDPARQLVIATNGNWRSAVDGEQSSQRQTFYRAVSAAIDREISTDEMGDSGVEASEHMGFPEIRDGDTVVIGGTEYRFDGIDSPESGAKCDSLDVYENASEVLTNIIAANPIECVPTGKKNRGRLIATCFAIGNGGAKTNLSERMVELGWARDWPRFSNGRFAGLEADARENGVGIWGLNCPSDLWRNRNYEP